MFRLTQFMNELVNPTPLGTKRNPPGPVVIWNLIRRCNLTCKHCYSISADIDFKGELSTAEVFTVMDDLKAFGVPVLDITESTVKLALQTTPKCVVGIMASRAAVDSNCYPETILSLNSEAKVYSAACPLLVTLVEEGWLKKRCVAQ